MYNKIEEKIKQTKGITLIALVITIIVLLILAGITIASLSGDNGILTRAKEARDKTQIGSIIESAKMDILEEQVKNDGEIIESELQKVFSKYFENIPADLPDNFTETTVHTKDEYGDYYIKVSDIWNGKFGEEGGGEVTEVTAANYGDKVDGYISQKEKDEGINLTWRIFYHDDNYVYLISSKEDGSNTVESCQLDQYPGSTKTYNGSAYITDSFLQSLNSQWFGVLGSTPSTKNNAKAVAYLMDQEVWDEYKDSEENAAYAIGSPTLELYANSYNKTSIANSREHQIEITDCTSTGYSENTSSGWLSTEFNNGIYNNGSSSYWWLASPRSSGSDNVFRVDGFSGILLSTSVGGGNGLRPIVIIPKSKFQYKIVPET